MCLQICSRGLIRFTAQGACRFVGPEFGFDMLDTNIRVTKISPGLVETEFSVVRLKGDAEAAKNVYNGLVPLTGDDIADNIVYCASRFACSCAASNSLDLAMFKSLM